MEAVAEVDGLDARTTIALLGGLRGHTSGVELAYGALDLMVAEHGLSEAFLVVHPDRLSPQVFAYGRRNVPPERAIHLTGLPTGVYTTPDTAPMAVRDALAGSCELALTADTARRLAAVDAHTGLSSQIVIESGVRLAANRSSRFRWPSCFVLLAAEGDGSPAERWHEMAAAVRATLRGCDEAGVAGSGRAMVILANAGQDAVAPFVERVRAALDAGGTQDLGIVVGSAVAPMDSVDPDQLWRLCEERLADAMPAPSLGRGAPRAERRPSASEVELELRCLPGVVAVGTSGLKAGAQTHGIEVVALASTEELREAAAQVVASHLGDVPVTVLEAGGGMDPAAADAFYEATGGAPTGEGSHANVHPPGPPRVTLLLSAFDPSTGASEVSLSWHGLKAVGRATGTPVVGAAQATLTALEALGAEVPYYLESVDRATPEPGSPVVVALVQRQGDASLGGGRRLGVACGKDQVEAASRATLSALNRLLSCASSTGTRCTR